jgi:hypothetical protein
MISLSAWLERLLSGATLLDLVAPSRRATVSRSDERWLSSVDHRRTHERLEPIPIRVVPTRPNRRP